MAFYGVWVGKKPGIYTEWSECLAQVKGTKGAQYKKMEAKTEAAAKIEFKGGYKPNTGKSKEKAKKKTSAKVRNLHLNKGLNYFSDGACQHNPGASGSGVSIYKDGVLMALKTGGFHKEGSNNISELEGILFCLESLSIRKGTATIYSDSQYSIDCLTKWGYNWMRNGWKKSDGKDVENKELIQKCMMAYQKVKDRVVLEKVKAHIGERGNELADRMAIMAVLKKQVDWVTYEETDINKVLKIEYT